MHCVKIFLIFNLVLHVYPVGFKDGKDGKEVRKRPFSGPVLHKIRPLLGPSRNVVLRET